MPTHLDHVQAYKVIKAWADEAKRNIQDKAGTYPTHAPEEFLTSLLGGVFLSADLGELDERGRTLISLSVAGPKKVDIAVTRFMLPVHTALTRLLELSGAKIKLIRGGGIDKYYFDLKIDKLRTNLHRPLFGVPSSGRCWERDGLENGYRYIVPSYYQVGEGLTRERILAAVNAKLTSQSQKRRIDQPAAVISVLRTLFAVQDHWHWDELVGRPADGDGERFRL